MTGKAVASRRRRHDKWTFTVVGHGSNRPVNCRVDPELPESDLFRYGGFTSMEEAMAYVDEWVKNKGHDCTDCAGWA